MTPPVRQKRPVYKAKETSVYTFKWSIWGPMTPPVSAYSTLCVYGLGFIGLRFRLDRVKALCLGFRLDRVRLDRVKALCLGFRLYRV